MMTMSNSPLVSYTRISSNSNNPRNKPILKITPHHMAGNLSLQQFGDIVANKYRQMSANYAIDSNGNIGLFCDEDNRSWCSSSAANDNMAITIEVANDGGAPDWHISDAAFVSLINLCVDICQRNGIKTLNFTGDASGNLTQHNYFSATACPGPYLKSKFGYIADEVNKRLKKDDEPMWMSTSPVAMQLGAMTGGDYKQMQALLDSLQIKHTETAGGLIITEPVSKGDQGAVMLLADSLKVGCVPYCDTAILQAQIGELTADNKQVKAEMAALTKRLENSESLLVTKGQEVIKAEAYAADVEARYTAQAAELTEAEQHTEILQREIKAAQDATEKLQAEIDEMKATTGTPPAPESSNKGLLSKIIELLLGGAKK